MKLIPVGGYHEFGRNMTVIEENGESVVVDMGLKIENVMGEDLDLSRMSREELYALDAIPEAIPLKKVSALAFSHGHMDHIGSASKLAPVYNADIVGTPLTLELLRRMFLDEKRYKFRGHLRQVLPGASIKMGNFELEFIQASHSIPDSALVAIRAGRKTALYANDFKFDESPIVGYKTNTRRLEQLGKEGVDLMIFDVTRIDRPGHTPSEVVAKEKIDNALKNCDAEAVIATTFASHAARISELIEAARRMNRIPILLGRSMRRYSQAAVKFGFLPPVKYYARKKELEAVFQRVKKDPFKYLLICTGNQAEPNSVMDRLVAGKFEYKITPEDWVLFCSEIIPNDVNVKFREAMEKNIRDMGAKIYRDLHVSGHCSREDTRELIKLVNPKMLAPTHGSGEKMKLAADLAAEEGYKLGRDVHILKNREELVF